jgi:hypothetical protein
MAMAKNKKWSKMIARIQALEDALAGLLSAKPRKTRKPAKAKAAKPARTPRAKSKRVKAAPKPAKAVPKKSRPAVKTAKRSRKKTVREIVAENAPILPGVPVGLL